MIFFSFKLKVNIGKRLNLIMDHVKDQLMDLWSLLGINFLSLEDVLLNIKCLMISGDLTLKLIDGKNYKNLKILIKMKFLKDMDLPWQSLEINFIS